MKSSVLFSLLFFAFLLFLLFSFQVTKENFLTPTVYNGYYVKSSAGCQTWKCNPSTNSDCQARKTFNDSKCNQVASNSYSTNCNRNLSLCR